jgi:FAD/FMN-containing dehydrogenase
MDAYHAVTTQAGRYSFALAILGSNGPAAYTGLPAAAPDLHAADHDAAAIRSSMAALRAVVPSGGSYVSESDFFEKNWQRSFWGDHYSRLRAVKMKYDPTGLFFVHHGVGSECWSPDGFTRIHNT